MVDQVITKQELIDAQKDAQTLEDVINGAADTQVTARMGRTFWTLATLNSKLNSVETAATQAIASMNSKVAGVETARVNSISAMNSKVASVEHIFDDKLSEWDDEAQTEINEWRSAISIITQEGGVPALAVADASGQTQQEINDFGGAEWRSKAGGYKLGSTVKLENGDIVKSTVANNTVDPNVDMTDWVNKSLLARNRIVYFEDYVSDSTGTTDVTAEMQSLLDSHDGDIYAKSDSVFKTSNTLFNRKHNRTIDFHNAKIVNKSNSRYAIVTISPAFVGNSEAQLAVFSAQRHYGSEVRSSHIKNLRYEMSSKSEVGANLGVGIIYGYKCFASRLYPIMTNGNGFEIRNSLQCGIYDSEIDGHRNYTCFVFMSKKCFVIRNKLKGGMRGVSTKMNRDGDPNCDHVIAFNTFEDSTSVARSIVGGEWRETNLTDEIYVSGHEWVDGNLIYGNTFTNNTQPQTIHAACFSRNWKIYNNTFDWNNLGGQIVNFGGEGNVVNGEALGGGHEFYSNTIYDYDSNDNNIIGFALSGNVYKNKFYNCKSTLWCRADSDMAGKPLKFARFDDNEFLGENNAVYCGVARSCGFVGGSGVLSFSFSGNSGKLTALTNGAQKSLTLFVSAASNSYLSDGDLEIVAGEGVESVFAAMIQAGSIRSLSGRRVTLSAPNTVYALQILSGVNVECKHENNSYNLVGISTLARAVVNNAELVDGINSYNGSWNAKIFNSYSKPVAITNIDRQWSVMPTTGSYNKGDFVRNTNPSIVANSVIFGWLRITSGSSHVLNTDWVEIKQSTI